MPNGELGLFLRENPPPLAPLKKKAPRDWRVQFRRGRKRERENLDDRSVGCEENGEPQIPQSAKDTQTPNPKENPNWTQNKGAL